MFTQRGKSGVAQPPVLIASEILFRRLAFVFPKPLTTVSRQSHECHISETGSLAAFFGTWMALLVPSKTPFDATFPVHCSQDCFARCLVLLHPSTSSGCSTGSCCVLSSLGVNASCLISTSCVLAVPINSLSLYALILNDHVVHRQNTLLVSSRVSCLPGSSQLAPRSVPSQFVVLSTLVPLHQVAPLAMLPVPSIDETPLLTLLVTIQ